MTFLRTCTSYFILLVQIPVPDQYEFGLVHSAVLFAALFYGQTPREVQYSRWGVNCHYVHYVFI